MVAQPRKPLHFVGSALKDLRGLPEDVQDVFGSALLDTQYGDHPSGARPFGEGVSRAVMKLVEDYDGNTYRAAYTVSFEKAVYVPCLQEEVQDGDPNAHVGPRPR